MDSQKPELIIKIVSRESDLLAVQVLKCSVTDCKSTFQNKSNLQMHLEKQHKIISKSLFNSSNIVQYYCPHNNCKYNISQDKEKFFTSRKFLKQHFLKMHAPKNVECKKCNRKFSTNTLKEQHERVCGTLFKCTECEAAYASRECLLTHCRRKNHRIPVHVPQKRKKLAQSMATKQTSQIPIKPKIFTEADIKAVLHASEVPRKRKQPSVKKQTKSTKATQTEPDDLDNSLRISKTTRTTSTRCDIQESSKSFEKYKNLDLIDEESNTLISISSQTFKNLNSLNFVEEDSSLNCFGNTNSSFCHIETQTELISFDNSNSIDSAREMDPMLCHTHTQTSDDILTELGLADIETQTNWQDDDYSELFVSTETQTCFSSLIMDNNSTQTQTMSDLSESGLLFKSSVPYFGNGSRCTQMQQTEE